MSRQDKKQRHKAKRKAKQLEARRKDSISPVKRLADSKGEIECWMSEDFQGVGQAQIFARKSAAGLSGIACFLVDRGVVGLKDAWTRMRVDPTEFSSMLEASGDNGIPMVRCKLEDARRLIAGGIRWAHQNGMRLPKDWAKPASLIGGVGDWATADVSPFVMEFAGHPKDLRNRLIGQPFEEYIQRKDIDFTFADDAPVMDPETGEYLDPDDDLFDDDDDDFDAFDDFDDSDDSIPEEEVTAMAEQLHSTATELAARTATWLGERGESPSVELVDAWQSVLVVGLLSNASMPDSNDAARNDVAGTLFDELASRISADREDEYTLAMEQIDAHVRTNRSMIAEALARHKADSPSGEEDDGPLKFGWQRDE